MCRHSSGRGRAWASAADREFDVTQDKQLKRAARDLVASTPGLSYQAALYQVDPGRASRPPPTAQLRAAVDVLLRAWLPAAAPASVVDEDDDPFDDETNGCGCAGEDEDGEPRGCNCGDGCGCVSCVHYQYAQTRFCELRVPAEGQPYARCGRPTELRIRIGVHRGRRSRPPSDGDPAPVDKWGRVEVGDDIQAAGFRHTCSTQHARELIEQSRASRAAYDSDPTFYEVETFRYAPDRVDVPGPLHPLLDALTSGTYYAKAAIHAEFTRAGGRAPDVDFNHQMLLKYVARAARDAVDHLDQLAQDDADRAVDLALDSEADDRAAHSAGN